MPGVKVGDIYMYYKSHGKVGNFLKKHSGHNP